MKNQKISIMGRKANYLLKRISALIQERVLAAENGITCRDCELSREIAANTAEVSCITSKNKRPFESTVTPW